METIFGEVKFRVLRRLGDGSVVIPHNEIMKVAMEHSDRITYSTKLLYAAPPYNFAFEAQAIDSVTGRRVDSIVGESTPGNLENEIMKNNPCNQAHVRAIDRALIKLFGMEGKVYSNQEIPVPEEHASAAPAAKPASESASADKTAAKPSDGAIKVTEKAEANSATKSAPATAAEPAPGIDGTKDFKILFGNCRGQMYSAVKDTDKFKSFLSWIAENKDMKFKDERQAQLEFFRKL